MQFIIKHRLNFEEKFLKVKKKKKLAILGAWKVLKLNLVSKWVKVVVLATQ